MPTARFQPSFAGGVLGPGLHGRIDQSKYDVGLKVGKNIFIHAHGGFSNRPGLEFVGEVMDSTVKHRLFPFNRGADDNYVLLLGDSEMKVIDEGAFLETSPGVDYNPATPFAASILFDLQYTQSIDVMFWAHPSLMTQKMSRTGVTAYSFAGLAIDPTVTAPGAPTITPSSADGITVSYRVSAVIDGVEGFPSAVTTNANSADLTIAGRKNTVSWTGTGADEYNVYKDRSGIYGYVGFTEGTSFVDDNISADTTLTPVQAADVFGSADNYPSHVALVQQRLALANTNNEPETVWLSRTGDFENFTKSRVLKADDRIQLDITGNEVNRIEGMTQLRELIVFTASGEFTIAGPDGVLSATNPVQTQYGYSGSSGVRPIVIEDTMLFVDRTGRQVRDLRYSFEQDGYTGNDLTIWASHYFENKQIVEWAYQRNPYSIVWVCLDDGTLHSFTYKREHQVWAWTEHEVGGEVESIATIREGVEDAVYMIVKRTINSLTKRYVERLKERIFTETKDFFGVDSGITYEGVATTTITGLDHLEGETVVALADGAVVENLTVASGQVTLPAAASTVHVGLFHPAEAETLPPSVDLRDVGSARGRPMRASDVYIQLEKTRGIEIGVTSRKMAPLIAETDDLSVAREGFTGMERVVLPSEWNTDGTIVVQQNNPLPMTVLGISPEYTVGRSRGRE